MTEDALDPAIHVPARLRIVATLAALPDGDVLSFPRLQDMTELTPGHLLPHLRELEHAGYARRVESGVTLTHDGRGALERYTGVLRHLAAGAAGDHLAPGPDVRIGDADRDAAVAALGEHFARGRLTLDELDARLGAVLAATTHGEVSQATWDLPDVRVVSVTSARRQRTRRDR